MITIAEQIKREEVRRQNANRERIKGESKTQVYKAWYRISLRYWKEMDPKWFESYDAFKRDVGKPPSPEHQLWRVDASKPWSISNIQWIGPHDQSKVKDSPSKIKELKKFSYRGEIYTRRELARELGITLSQLDYRTVHWPECDWGKKRCDRHTLKKN